jgi:acetylornithine deacetylase/succinyl-diaminopimelate desuccinylase-like protein
VSPHEAIDRDFDAHLERIREFLRIPSVSAGDGEHRAACLLLRSPRPSGSARA